MLKLNHQKGYRKFINERDNALEVLLRNSRLRISELTADTFRKALETIHLKYGGIMTSGSRLALDHLEKQIELLFEHLAFQIWLEIIELRKKAYMLAHAGEAQAIAQTVAKTAKIDLNRNKLNDLSVRSLSNGLAPMKSFNLRLNKVRRQISSSLEYSLAFGEPVDKALGRVFFVLPKKRVLPKKKVLKTVKLEEAKRPKFSSYERDDSVEISIPAGQSRQAASFGFEWDQETWDKIVDDLGHEHVFTDRSPEKFLDITNPWNDLKIREDISEEDKIYHWEIEQEVVNDFVEQVRKGQVDSAKKNGIDDFVWIAILDDRIDECCEWRSGLLTSEIEHKLKNERKDDDCRAIVPPAHFNCATAGHKITTSVGDKLIEDIQIGDMVLTHEGRYRKVERCLQSIANELLEIELENGKKITVTPEHPFLVNGKWIEAKELTEFDCLTLGDLGQKNDI